jgi:hypothetical protein
MHAVQRTIRGLTTGLLEVPAGVDPGDFILSGGTLKQLVSRASEGKNTCLYGHD